MIARIWGIVLGVALAVMLIAQFIGLVFLLAMLREWLGGGTP